MQENCVFCGEKVCILLDSLQSIARIAQGKSIVHVQASEISKIQITYPDPETQCRIIKMLEAISSRVELCEKELENLIKLRSSLLQQLFI